MSNNNPLAVLIAIVVGLLVFKSCGHEKPAPYVWNDATRSYE